MIHFDEPQTARALPFDRLTGALRATFRRGCNVPLRHTHVVETPQAQGTVLLMPAWDERYLGIKTVNIFPGNAARGLPGLFSVYTLFDAATGRPLAQMDGNVITSRRTAAASALAASFLVRPGARRLLVCGAGRVGRLLPQAYRAVLDLEEVHVWARDPAKAEAVAQALREQGETGVKALARLQDAAAAADIVAMATLATEPVLQGAWLAEGSHLDLIGSFTPQMREADDAAFAGAQLFVDTTEALDKSGELLGPMGRGVFRREDVAATLADLCAGRHPGRTDAAGRTVFKSVGTALEDLAAAILVYETWNAPAASGV